MENAGNSSSSLEQSSTTTTDDREDPRGNESKPKKPKGSSKLKSKNNNKKDKNTSDQSQSQESQKDKKTNKNKNNKNNNSKNNNNNKNKKQAAAATKQRSKPTRGILHGLSTLKRNGAVAVIRQGDKVRVVRATFFLGPVSLEILPKVSILLLFISLAFFAHMYHVKQNFAECMLCYNFQLNLLKPFQKNSSFYAIIFMHQAKSPFFFIQLFNL